MDTTNESRWEKQRSRPSKDAPQVVCLVLMVLGSSALYSQTNTIDQSALLALQTTAEKGDARAQRQLADTYAGWLDSTNAVVWYRKAAEQGDAPSQWQLARYYEFGAGELAVDRDAALTWYLRAATQGCSHAQLDLGQMYEGGRTGAPDYIEAHKWYTIALRNDSVLARANRDRLQSKMTSQQVEEAQRRADAFKTAPTLDPAVEALLARMSEAVSPSNNALERRVESAGSEPRPTPAVDPVSLETLLARMSEAVSVPAHSGENSSGTPASEPRLVASLDPELIGGAPAIPPDPGRASFGAAEQKSALIAAVEEAASLGPSPAELPPPALAEFDPDVLSQTMNTLTRVGLPEKPAVPVEPSSEDAGKPVTVVPTPVSTNGPSAGEPAKLASPADPAPAKSLATALTKAAPASPAVPASNSVAAAKQPPATPSPLRAGLTEPSPAPVSKTSSTPMALTRRTSPAVDGTRPKRAGWLGLILNEREPATPGRQTPPAPASTRTGQGSKPATFLEPALLEKLHVQAIAAFGKRRAASINGRSIFEGEEAELNIDGVGLKVRCIQIKNASVVLQVAGIAGTTELAVLQSGR